MLEKIKGKAGFTLMELIIVMVVLAILALIAIPRLLVFAEQAKIADDKEYAAVMARTAEVYWAANDAPASSTVTYSADVMAGNGLIDDPSSSLQYIIYIGENVALASVETSGVCTVTLDDGTNSIVFNTIDGYSE